MHVCTKEPNKSEKQINK